MRNHVDAYKDDHMSLGRGVAFGVIFGTVLWGLIIAVAVYGLGINDIILPRRC